MKNYIWVMSIAALIIAGCGQEQNGKKDATGIQAYSLFDKPFHTMKDSPAAKAKKDSNLAVAKANFDRDPDDEENIIWLGRRIAYFTRYKEAIDVFTEGINKHPESAKLLRHRGHRYISIREFDKAIADLERAASLIKGTPDEVEQDGAPNKYNIPTSTLHFNIWYHLGLAHYLKADFESALRSFTACLAVSKNNDALVATSDWLYMINRRLEDKAAAARVLENITEGMKILENGAYYDRLLLYKGLKTPESILNFETDDALALATYGYGIGNWYLYNGEQKKAIAVFKKVVAGKYWPAFGFIAAEAELKALNSPPSR